MYALGFITPSGRVTPEDLFVAADIAEVCGSGAMANSCLQNLLVMDIPENRLEHAQDMALNAPTLTLKMNHIRAGLVVCTGSEFCNLALTETKQRSFPLLDYLEREVPLDTPIKISISGCPNSCSQYQAADIGLRGGITRIGDETVEAYDFFVGTRMGEEPSLSQRIRKAVPADEIGPVIAEMLKTYMRDRKNGETFQEYSRRMQTMSFDI
jgi:ferredoxin-nitrite reductase